MYQRLKELRTLELIPQTELANLINVKQNTFSEYENEYKIIPLSHLIILCDYLHVSIDYIFGFTDLKNYNSFKKSFDIKLSAARLKEFRKQNKLTQTNLGEILKCSYGTLAGYETGRYLIATPFLYTICRDYHVSADYLLGRTNSKYVSNKCE